MDIAVLAHQCTLGPALGLAHSDRPVRAWHPVTGQSVALINERQWFPYFQDYGNLPGEMGQ